MTFSKKQQPASNEALQYALIALCALGTFLLLGWLLKYSAYGLDFTDESLYLVWMSNPFIYTGSITQFGFVYHPLHNLVDGDIVELRQANILVTFSLAWCMTYVLWASLVPELKQGRVTLCVVSAALASSSLIFFDAWLPTPSYNSLAFQSMLICVIGLLLAQKSMSRWSLVGWILIGVGGWLAFMAKPSTAFALAIGALAYLLLSRKFTFRLLSLAVVTALVLLSVSALLIDGSILYFVERLKLGLELSQYLGGGHTISQLVRIDSFQLNSRAKLTILLICIVLCIAIWSMWTKSKKWSVIGLLVSVGFLVLTILLTLGQVHETEGVGQFQGLLVFGLIYAAVVSGVVLGRREALTMITASQWSIACLFLIMPHLYAFGTNGNYWQTGGSTAIFWLLSGTVLLGPLVRERASWFLMFPFAFAVQAVSATLLHTGLEQPYRQTQPLRLNVAHVELGAEKSTLILSDAYAAYIAAAVQTAREAGFVSMTPMIDLSGQSPGILYALGAESVGQAWTIGGYPGSLKLAEEALARTPCEDIAASWVLFEPDGPRAIPIELMARLGANFPGDYAHVGEWKTAQGAGGYAASRTQELYKPTWPQKTLETCKIQRAKVSQ